MSTRVSAAIAQLKKCGEAKDLQRGRIIHAQIRQWKGTESAEGSIQVANTLLSMYAKCGAMAEAAEVFDSIAACRDVVSWNVLILGYAQSSRGQSALDCFARMDCSPNSLTFLAAIRACAAIAAAEHGDPIKVKALRSGMGIHARAAAEGCDSEVMVGNSLIDMYAKCGDLLDARRIFDAMPEHTVVSWTVLVLGYVENGEAEMGIELFDSIPEGCGPIGARALVAGLKACSGIAAREAGEDQGGGRVVKVGARMKAAAVHRRAVELGCEMESFVSSSLVDAYSRCGDLEEASKVLSRMSSECLVSTTALMLGYAENGQGDRVLELFSRIKARDSRAFVAATKGCIALALKEDGELVDGKLLKIRAMEAGMKIHSECRESGSGIDDIFVSSSLVDMYAKCGSMIDARIVFDKMEKHSVVAWTALILGYAENEDEAVSWQLLSVVENLNALTIIAGLKACAGFAGREDGSEIDRKLVTVSSLEKVMDLEIRCRELGLDSDIFVANTLIGVYAKCGSIADARSVFDRMKLHSTVSWTALAMGCVENGEFDLALELFASMRSRIAPSSLSFVAAMNACSGLAAGEEATEVDGVFLKIKSLDRARTIFAAAAAENLFETDVFVANSAVDMFAKCGSLAEARRIFEGIAQRSTVSWNALMLGYAENGEGEQCLEMFARMEKEGYRAEARTYFAALRGCFAMASKEGENRKKFSLERGGEIHLRAAENRRCDLDVFVASALVELYAKCGNFADARRVLDEMPSINNSASTALIQGYLDCGEELAALEMFRSFQSRGYVANVSGFVAAIRACTNLADKEQGAKIDARTIKIKMESLESGMAIHFQVVGSDYNSNTMLANALIDMYAKCASLVDSRRVFDTAMFHTDSSWNTLITGYAENDEPDLALELFERFRDSFPPNSRTLVAALKACGMVPSLATARAIHAEILKRGMDRNTVLESSLVDVYGKCGSMDAAQRQFDAVASGSRRDLITWNALLAGYARQGDAGNVLGLFRRFGDEGLQPDEISLGSILSACARAGLVDEGRKMFSSMRSKYGLAPGVEHYRCVVDLLGRSNRVDEAVEVAESMPFEADKLTWMTLLAACGKWKNAPVGKVAFDKLMELDQTDAATYVSMANVYV